MIVWVDLETTGLDANEDRILEIGSIVTDDKLNELGSFNRVLFATPEQRDAADPFVQNMHDKSGLWQKCYDSNIHLIDAEEDLMDFWFDCFRAGGGNEDGPHPPLGGSSVHFDRAFMAAKMPESLACLAYRNIDVSSIKEVVKRVAPDFTYQSGVADTDKPHRTIADLENSIAELKYYVETFFTSGANNG